MSARVQSRPGFVYVMRSPATAEGLYKIGLTRSEDQDTRALERRAKEISTATGAPGVFSIVARHHYEDCVLAELWVHDLLSEYRTYGEFFWLPGIAVAEAALEEAVHKLGEYRSEGSRRSRLTSKFGNHLSIADLVVDAKVTEAHLDYAEGTNMIRHSPAKGERLLLRAAGRLLPEHLAPYEMRIVRALRRLGEFHANGRFVEPFAAPRRWPHEPTQEALDYMRSSEAVRYFTMAADEGDFISRGLLAQHLLALDDLEAAQSAFVGFTDALAEATSKWRRFDSSLLYSPVNSARVGLNTHDKELVVQILATFGLIAERSKLAPLPERSRSVLLLLLYAVDMNSVNPKRKEMWSWALKGLEFGPEIDNRRLNDEALPASSDPQEGKP